MAVRMVRRGSALPGLAGLGAVTAFKLPKSIYSGPYFIPGIDFEVSTLSRRTLLTEERAYLLDTHVGMVSVYSAFNLPLALYLLKNFFSSIPRQLEEAAAVDGMDTLPVLTLETT